MQTLFPVREYCSRHGMGRICPVQMQTDFVTRILWLLKIFKIISISLVSRLCVRLAVSIILPYPSWFHLPAFSPRLEPNQRGSTAFGTTYGVVDSNSAGLNVNCDLYEKSGKVKLNGLGYQRVRK